MTTSMRKVMVLGTLLGASTTTASLTPYLSTSAQTKSLQDTLSPQDLQTKFSSPHINSGGSVSTTTAVDTGAWSNEDHGSSCTSLTSEPVVTGYNLDKCVGSFGGSSVSTMYTSCEMSSDMTTLTVYYNYYASSAFCSSTPDPRSIVYSGLVNGCKLGTKYQCSETLGFATYGSPQHIGNWNQASCGSTSDEMEWNVWYYDSCTDDNSCTVASPSYSFQGLCDDPDNVCFHVDTKIDYKGVEYTFQDLLAGKEPECSVPHTPRSRGVVIKTSCDKTVRVTDTHLLATNKGFRLAYSLKAGDVLFGDYDKDECVVQSVEKEASVEQYFGLNCVHSEVLASGIRASTFGDFHTLPSWYMTYVGGIVGNNAATLIGSYIAEWYFAMN